MNSDNINYQKIETAITPCPGVFPIVVTNPFVTSRDLNITDLHALEECGINLGVQSASIPDFLKMSNILKGSSFKLIFESEYLHDRRFYNFSEKDIEDNKAINTWQYFVNMFTKYPTTMFEYEEECSLNPNLGGWFFKKLSLHTNLDDLSNDAFDLAAYQPSMISYSPFIYFNLENGLNEVTNAPTSTLFNHFQQLVDTLSPSVLSYSYFPIWNSDSGIYIDYTKFYAYLEAASKSSYHSKLPFWAYCLSNSIVSPNIEYPVPLEGYIRFIVFSSLGYGAQGIVYDSFNMPPNQSDKIFIMSPVDRDGNKTPIWYWLKKVNEDIRNFEDVFLGAEPIDTIHTGLPELITNAKGSDSYGPIKYMEYDDKGVQISFLRNKEKEYMLVVNHDIESSQTFKIRNEEGFPMKELRSNQIIYPFLLSKFIMLPGDFLLFEYSKPEPN